MSLTKLKIRGFAKNFAINSGIVRRFQSNCGMHEHSLHVLRERGFSTPQHIINYFTEFFSEDGGGRGGAALLFSDNSNKATIHNSLSQVGQEIALGVNPNSGNRIYSWIVSRQSIANYKAKQKRKKSGKAKPHK